MKSQLLAGAAASAATVAALSFPWQPAKPPPTFSASVPISCYTEQLPDGRIVGCWYAYARGRFDLATGETIPLSDEDQRWDAHMAGMYGDSETPRYELTARVPLPVAEQLQPLMMVIDGKEYRWDGKKWVVK